MWDPVKRLEFFDHLKSIGAAGSKIDFFDHEAKEIEEWMVSGHTDYTPMHFGDHKAETTDAHQIARLLSFRHPC